jgi:hypothetical protein
LDFALGYLGTYSCIGLSLLSFSMAGIKDSCLCWDTEIIGFVWHGMEGRGLGKWHGIGFLLAWICETRMWDGQRFLLRLTLVSYWFPSLLILRFSFWLGYHGPVLHSVITKLVGFGLLVVSFTCIWVQR